ncbi:NUDIX hydrolase [Nocardioides sp. SYSU DS0663]|uniref:NUDIX hydrolase n=1 Tax=Nocardioides sp. SYSU DS0663 TaxID=3416445 RepID=UPI003F4B2E4D
MAPRPDPSPDVHAAGAVVLGPGRRVVLVHRPKYDDWSFPKGKLDPGEHAITAAVREVAEETGLAVRLGPPLTGQRYPVAGGRMKTVHYWVGRLRDPDAADVSGHTCGDEIDRVAWFSAEEAASVLSYDHDRVTLAEALAVPRKTRPLVVLRHGQAHPRKQWREDDRLRPLAPAGREEALALVPILDAYAAGRVVTSPSTRCVETVLPYAGARGLDLVEEPALTEEQFTVDSVGKVVRGLLESRERAVLCTHRPVLPHVFAGAGVPDPRLRPAGLLVVHHRAGEVVATESHRPPA